MSKKKPGSSGAIIKILDYCYEAALQGLPGQETVYQLVEDYLGEKGTLDEKIGRLIRWQNAKCAASGFLSGLGGIMTLPVAIPADLAACYYIQIRMIGAIALMRGYDLHNDKVRTLVYLCLCGDGVREVMKDLGIQIGKNFAKSAVQKISGASLRKINQAVGFRLFTKFGEKGVINIGKGIPIVGGLIGASVNAYACNIVGGAAKDVFTKRSSTKRRSKAAA